MYVIAVIGDLLSVIPILNFVTDPLTAFALYLASDSETNLYSHDQVMKTLLVIAAEALPIFAIVPFWCIRVYLAKQDAKRRKQ